MQDFKNENVLQYSVKAFAETIALKVKQLRDYVPKKRDLTNTELTGNYIEELVRGFIQNWIGHRELLTGTFYFQELVGCVPRTVNSLQKLLVRGTHPTRLRRRLRLQRGRKS